MVSEFSFNNKTKISFLMKGLEKIILLCYDL